MDTCLDSLLLPEYLFYSVFLITNKGKTSEHECCTCLLQINETV